MSPTSFDIGFSLNPCPRKLRAPQQEYAVDSPALTSTIHAVVTVSDGGYVAECLEVAVVTQGQSLDEVVANLNEAVALHLQDEDPAEFGLSAAPRPASGRS